MSASPGASESYLGGVVTYATSVKTGLLGIAEEAVDEHGVVSAPAPRDGAERVASCSATDWARQHHGGRRPTEQEGKPVGTVFVGLAGPGA